MLGPTEINAVFDEIVDEQLAEGKSTIKIRCQEICSRLNATSERDVLSVYEVLSTRIYMIPNKNAFDHDIPDDEMERARIWFEKNNTVFLGNLNNDFLF